MIRSPNVIILAFMSLSVCLECIGKISCGRMGWLWVLANGIPPLVSLISHFSVASSRPVRSWEMPATDAELEYPDSDSVCPVVVLQWLCVYEDLLWDLSRLFPIYPEEFGRRDVGNSLHLDHKTCTELHSMCSSSDKGGVCKDCLLEYQELATSINSSVALAPLLDPGISGVTQIFFPLSCEETNTPVE